MPRRKNNSANPKTPRRKRAKRSARPNWLDLPDDIIANILQRLGVFEILENAQKVCTSWYKICKNPAMWRVIDMKNCGHLQDMPYDLEKMCMHAVDRSQGQLVDINIEYFGTADFLLYVARRCSQLRRLLISCCDDSIDEEVWSKVLKKFPLLEELSFIATDIQPEDIEEAGLYCPQLKTFRLNHSFRYPSWYVHEQDIQAIGNEEVSYIAKSFPQLRHLQLIDNGMTNKGLRMILNKCPHLESLDLRRCFNVNLNGSLGKRCLEQIKILRLPNDSMEDYGFELYEEEWHHIMLCDG